MYSELMEYISSDDHEKMRKGRKYMDEIYEMREDWGIDGANSLAMAGAAMVVTISALSFWAENIFNRLFLI